MATLTVNVAVRIQFSALLMAALVVGVAPASAEKYLCDVVNDIARLGTHPRNRVAVESDDDDPDDGRFCAFSVNGWPASSPPRKKVIEGLDILDSGLAGGLIQKKPELFAAILMSAGAAVEPSTELTSLLTQWSKDLTNCLNEFFLSDSLPSYELGNNSCRGFAPGQYELFVITTPKLEIRVIADGKIRRLYLPRRRR